MDRQAAADRTNGNWVARSKGECGALSISTSLRRPLWKFALHKLVCAPKESADPCRPEAPDRRMGRGAAPGAASHASRKVKPPSRCAGTLLVNSGPLSSAKTLSGVMPGRAVFSA